MKEIVTPYDLIVERLKKDYPIGTKFLSVLSPDCEYEVKNHSFFNYSTDEVTVNEHNGPSIYRDGVFAKIVSLPEPKIINIFPIY